MSRPHDSSCIRWVLTISDDEKLRQTLTRGLNRYDFEVVAVSCDSALKVLGPPPETSSVPRPDVVLLDVPAGPEARALATLDQIRERGHERRTVCLVAPRDSSALAGWKTAGTLLKPIDMAELAAELGRVARQGAVPEESAAREPE